MEKYTAKYFRKTVDIIKKHKPESVVTLQFFQRQDDVMLFGIKESLDFLKENTDTSKYQIKYLEDGTIINAKDVVLELKGNYSEFGLYEGLVDGLLARATSLATNAYRVNREANGKPVIFMGDRTDHYINQARDGLAIAAGGIKVQVTDEQVSMHDGKAIGTVPHALIQMFDGDIVKALNAYTDTYPDEKLTALVDFNNDVISDSLKAYEAFKEKLAMVRIDTSDAVSDAMFKNDEEFGVTPNMVKNLRNALDEAGAKDVKIIVSSGFNVEKIRKFEEQNAPVDFYGVGGSLLKINFIFTADAVEIDGKKLAKVGREINDTSKLKTL